MCGAIAYLFTVILVIMNFNHFHLLLIILAFFFLGGGGCVVGFLWFVLFFAFVCCPIPLDIAYSSCEEHQTTICFPTRSFRTLC